MELYSNEALDIKAVNTQAILVCLYNKCIVGFSLFRENC